MTARPLILAAALFALAACGDVPERGLIRDTWHEPMSITIVPICQANGICTMVPITNPEQWHLKLTDDERTGWRSVSEGAYDTCDIGERYPECGGAR